MQRGKKMIGTIAKRLYKKDQDQTISSDEPFAKAKQSTLLPRNKGGIIDGETAEEPVMQQSLTNTKQQQQVLERPDSTSLRQNWRGNTDVGTGEMEEYATQQDSNLSDTKNK